MPAVKMVKKTMGDCLFFLVEQDILETLGGWLATLLAFLNLPLNSDLIRYSWGQGTCKVPANPRQGIGGSSEGKPPRSSANSAFSDIRKRPKINPEACYFLYLLIPTIILILLHPGPFTGSVLAVYMACVY